MKKPGVGCYALYKSLVIYYIYFFPRNCLNIIFSDVQETSTPVYVYLFVVQNIYGRLGARVCKLNSYCPVRYGFDARTGWHFWHLKAFFA